MGLEVGSRMEVEYLYDEAAKWSKFDGSEQGSEADEVLYQITYVNEEGSRMRQG